ncbi:MAG: metabolite traffic protein EboE [Planctomycetaceae bacterium]|nr:metabolite traffic protein EboE [Planctomycetaceae bacterium]
MSFATLPLSYCTNVHPAQGVGEVIAGLDRYSGPVRQAAGFPVAAGLWLAAPVISELQSDASRLDSLRQALERNNLACYTLNAFPYGDFHSERVKENVYHPDWTTDARLQYTRGCAAVLAELLPDGVEGSISTVPLGFKAASASPGFVENCIPQLLALARSLDDLHDATGRVIRLAIEPEPLCVLETTPETIAFFRTLFEAASAAGLLEIAQRHLGMCYDVCHQSVEFEDVRYSIQELRDAGVRINKVHITCAVRVENPSDPAVRAALADFAEPRYLHQTFARTKDRQVVFRTDLDRSFCDSPPPEFAAAKEWRVHFHVPVNAESIGPLQTTRNDLKRALKAVAELDYAPHLEVETYTWHVLPGEQRPSLVDGLTAEMQATRELLEG